MKKQIDMLTQILEKNGISLPNSSKKREGGSSSNDIERVHALVVGKQPITSIKLMKQASFGMKDLAT